MIQYKSDETVNYCSFTCGIPHPTKFN